MCVFVYRSLIFIGFIINIFFSFAFGMPFDVVCGLDFDSIYFCLAIIISAV